MRSRSVFFAATALILILVIFSLLQENRIAPDGSVTSNPLLPTEHETSALSKYKSGNSGATNLDKILAPANPDAAQRPAEEHKDEAAAP